MSSHQDACFTSECGSSTNPHPDSYLRMRIAKDLEPSTNPHPDSYVEARLAAEKCPVAPAHDTSTEDRPAPSDLPVSLRDLSLRDLSASARVVVSSAGLPANAPDDDGHIVPFRLPQTSRDVLVVSQSSQKPGFSLTIDELCFNFCYDVGSDNLVIRNLSPMLLKIAPLVADGVLDERKRDTLVPRSIYVLTPGPWRIFGIPGKPEAVVDFLILHRRYVLEAMAAGGAGSKRRHREVDNGPAKRHRAPDADKMSESSDALGVVVFGNSGREVGHKESTGMIIGAGNPLLDFRPGDALTVRMPSSSGASITPETRTAQPGSYTLSHDQDIAVTKGFSAIFRAQHSVHGPVAVKIIRTRKQPQFLWIPTMARDWQNEEGILRQLDHPSIIKFLGSDARLYSIYMEFLPYRDLAQWRDRSRKQYFTGTADDAERVLNDMASALDYISSKKIVHNDIKPSNILYEPEHGAILIDFGLASSSDDKKACTGGTPWYVPPEYLSQNRRGPESDVFALGVVLLYLLKATPLPDTTEQQWIISSVSQDPKASTIMQKWIEQVAKKRNALRSNSVEGITKNLLHPDPSKRHSAQQVLSVTRQS